MSDTYQIDTVDQIGPHLTPVTVREIACDTFVDCRCGDRTVTVQLGVPLCSGCDEAVGEGLDPCSCQTYPRPAEPGAGQVVWYRGWEVGFNPDADYWASQGWQAYKGGCDLDAPQVMARTFTACLDEVDAAEDD